MSCFKLQFAEKTNTLALLSVFFGVYSPYKKAQLVKWAGAMAGESRTVADFEATFARALRFPSPVGGEEAAGVYLTNLQRVVERATDPIVAAFLVRRAEEEMAPWLEGGSGAHLVPHIELPGLIYKAATATLGEKLSVAKQVALFERGLTLVPSYPPFLQLRTSPHRASQRRVGAGPRDRGNTPPLLAR